MDQGFSYLLQKLLEDLLSSLVLNRIVTMLCSERGETLDSDANEIRLLAVLAVSSLVQVDVIAESH